MTDQNLTRVPCLWRDRDDDLWVEDENGLLGIFPLTPLTVRSPREQIEMRHGPLVPNGLCWCGTPLVNGTCPDYNGGVA